MSKMLFVTLKEEWEPIYKSDGTWDKKSTGFLWFAAEYNKDKNQKQLEWAYGSFVYENDVVFIPEKEIQTVNGYKRWVKIGENRAEIQPLIIPNDVLDGFKVASFATRYSTSNKLIRILDPRGFELEISVANFLDIVHNCTIENGTIMSKCVWDFGKNGIGKAKLVLK